MGEKYDSDVGSTYPGGGEASKGLAVRQLKSYASWVQTVKQRSCFNFQQAQQNNLQQNAFASVVLLIVVGCLLNLRFFTV